ncbi:putative cuticle collagen 80 [Passer montanus]|uniref:putative cuticle collagen 80 n=1 Tax=Passer montanus TaxID=9160 RepID=UPI001961A1A2|nr:putative cuticle collagen 80 [Passer montanus]
MGVASAEGAGPARLHVGAINARPGASPQSRLGPEPRRGPPGATTPRLEGTGGTAVPWIGGDTGHGSLPPGLGGCRDRGSSGSGAGVTPGVGGTHRDRDRATPAGQWHRGPVTPGEVTAGPGAQGHRDLPGSGPALRHRGTPGDPRWHRSRLTPAR